MHDILVVLSWKKSKLNVFVTFKMIHAAPPPDAPVISMAQVKGGAKQQNRVLF